MLGPRHRAKEFIKFLKKIDRTVAKDITLHLILDNYATHKTAEVKAWLDKHKRFKVHFIPTSSSWLNLVERFFADITGKRIRRGAFTSIAELETAIDNYLEEHNAAAKPYVWTKTATEIVDKQRRAAKSWKTSKMGTKRLAQNSLYSKLHPNTWRPVLQTSEKKQISPIKTRI